MTNKTKFKYDKTYFTNRWRERHPHCDWVIIGLSKRWFSPFEYSYKISFFGFDAMLWFKAVEPI